jgi:hypothetical protein
MRTAPTMGTTTTTGTETGTRTEDSNSEAKWVRLQTRK